MFYSQVILARKGVLGKIWIAAHFDKKLTKNQIFSTDIVDSVNSILNPSVPLALRVSGHLMLGVVRIYGRKVKYLMTDCTEAMWKIKLAYRGGGVDLQGASGPAQINIDDARYFGHILPDTEFPEFAGAAFAYNALAKEEHIRVARMKTTATQSATTQSESSFHSFTHSEPLLFLGDEDTLGGTGGHKLLNVSGISELELARGRKSKSSLLGRASMSSIGAATSVAFDDDNIPAYDDVNGLFGESSERVLDDPFADSSNMLPFMEELFNPVVGSDHAESVTPEDVPRHPMESGKRGLSQMSRSIKVSPEPTRHRSKQRAMV